MLSTVSRLRPGSLWAASVIHHHASCALSHLARLGVRSWVQLHTLYGCMYMSTAIYLREEVTSYMTCSIQHNMTPQQHGASKSAPCHATQP